MKQLHKQAKKQWHRYRNVEQSFPINRTKSGGAGQDKVEKVGFNDMAWWHRWTGQKKCKNYFSLMFYVLASVLCCSKWGDDRRPWWGGQLCRVLDSGTQGGQSSNLDDEHFAFEVFLFACLETLISLVPKVYVYNPAKMAKEKSTMMKLPHWIVRRTLACLRSLLFLKIWFCRNLDFLQGEEETARWTEPTLKKLLDRCSVKVLIQYQNYIMLETTSNSRYSGQRDTFPAGPQSPYLQPPKKHSIFDAFNTAAM